MGLVFRWGRRLMQVGASGIDRAVTAWRREVSRGILGARGGVNAQGAAQPLDRASRRAVHRATVVQQPLPPQSAAACCG